MSMPVVVPNSIYNPNPDYPALYEQTKLLLRKKDVERLRGQHERGLRALEAYAAHSGDRSRADRIVRESESTTQEFDAEQHLRQNVAEDEEDEEDDDDSSDHEETEGELGEAAVLQQQYAAAKGNKDVPLPKFFPSPAPPAGSIKPLFMPVAIPQVLHTMLHSPFQLAYADVLADAGVSKEDFKMFLKGMNDAVAESPVFQVLGIASFAVGFVSSWEAQVVSIVAGAVAEVGAVIHSKARADAFLEPANNIFFRRRGLVCTVVTNKIKEELFANIAPTMQVEETHLPTYDEATGLPPNTDYPSYEADLPPNTDYARYEAGIPPNAGYLPYREDGQLAQAPYAPSPDRVPSATPRLSANSTPSQTSLSPSGSVYAPLTPLKPPPANPSAPKKFLDWATTKQNDFQAFMSKRQDKKLAKKLEKVRRRGERRVAREIARGKGGRKVNREINKMARKVRRVEKKRERKAKTGGPFWLIVLNDPDASTALLQ